MDATIMTTPHIGEYIAEYRRLPPRSQLERQEERGGIFQAKQQSFSFVLVDYLIPCNVLYL